VRNNAEQLVYSLEKLISENEDKIADEVKSEVQGDIDALKTALQGEDEAAIKSAFDKLNESQTKLGEAIYQASTEAAEGPSPTSGTAGASEEDVVDAEIVDDEDEKK
jgi:molecular chaperone DnaK